MIWVYVTDSLCLRGTCYCVGLQTTMRRNMISAGSSCLKFVRPDHQHDFQCPLSLSCEAGPRWSCRWSRWQLLPADESASRGAALYKNASWTMVQRSQRRACVQVCYSKLRFKMTNERARHKSLRKGMLKLKALSYKFLWCSCVRMRARTDPSVYVCAWPIWCLQGYIPCCDMKMINSIWKSVRSTWMFI
jgi:hypothetical protein